MVDLVLKIAQTSTLYHAEYVLFLKLTSCVFRVSVSFGTLSNFSAHWLDFLAGSLSRTRYELGGARKVPRTFRGCAGEGECWRLCVPV